MNGKRMLQNLPFAVSGGVLLALWAAGNSKKAVLLCGVLALAAAVALGRAPVLGRWLRYRRDPLGAVCFLPATGNLRASPPGWGWPPVCWWRCWR